MHGGMDSFSGFIVCLHCSNNKSDLICLIYNHSTRLEPLFRTGTQTYIQGKYKNTQNDYIHIT